MDGRLPPPTKNGSRSAMVKVALLRRRVFGVILGGTGPDVDAEDPSTPPVFVPASFEGEE